MVVGVGNGGRAVAVACIRGRAILAGRGSEVV
jgi:hypothetical protein